MRSIAFLLLMLAIFPLSASSQFLRGVTRQRVVDSLIDLLSSSSGIPRVDRLNALSMEIAPRNQDSALSYALEAGTLAESIRYAKGKGVALFNKGNAAYFRLDIKNALENYLAALRILEPSRPSAETGLVLTQLGVLNQYIANTDKVTYYMKRAMKDYLEMGDSLDYISDLQTLGTAYYFIWQSLATLDSASAHKMLPLIDSAILYHKQVIRFLTGRYPGIEYFGMDEHTGFGCFNYNIAGYYSIKKDPQLKEYYQKALDLVKDEKDPGLRAYLEGWFMSDMAGDIYFLFHMRDEGYEYAKKGVQLLRTTDNDDALATALSTLGAIETDQGHYIQGELCYLEGLNHADAFLKKGFSSDINDATSRIWGVSQVQFYKAGILKRLVHLYELKKDFRKALFFEKKLEQVKAEQSRDELTRQVTGLQAGYEDEMKRQEIDGLKKDNELQQLRINQARFIFGGIGAALLVLFLATMAWIQHRRRITEQKSLVLEQKLLRSQMNPHFIFNSLTNIQNFILTEKPEKASIYLTKFSLLVRNILDNSVEDYVPLEKEIETLEHYLELQKIRFVGKFDYRIHIPDDVDTDVLKIPPMLAQPFIENSIEHGIKHRETPGMIDIRFSIRGNMLVFEVEDNGIGREKAREISMEKDPRHKSMATSLTLERIANLNRKLKEKIRLEIIDLKNSLGEAEGTNVRFEIPV